MLQGSRSYITKSNTVPTLNLCIVLLWSQPEPATYLLPVWYKYMSEAHLVLAGTCTAKVSTDTSQYFYSRFYLYEDVWASSILIHYLASRLLVNELILHLASQSNTSIKQILLTAHVSHTIIQMAVEICVAAASQPLFPDYMSLDGRDYTSSNRNGAMPSLSGVFMFIYLLAVHSSIYISAKHSVILPIYLLYAYYQVLLSPTHILGLRHQGDANLANPFGSVFPRFLWRPDNMVSYHQSTTSNIKHLHRTTTTTLELLSTRCRWGFHIRHAP